MTVSVAGNVIRLEGQCSLEEAETLLQALLDAPSAILDMSGCTGLHGAVLQVILAANRELKAPLTSGFLKNQVFSGAV